MTKLGNLPVIFLFALNKILSIDTGSVVVRSTDTSVENNNTAKGNR